MTRRTALAWGALGGITAAALAALIALAGGAALERRVRLIDARRGA